MGLLGDIQSAIIDADRPLPAALRMAMVLAARLDNRLLRQWVDRELNGYPDDAELPAYRAKRPARVLGDFSGPLGLQADGFAIAPFQVKAEHRDVGLFDIAFNAAVATYEALLEGDGDDFQVPWPAGAVPLTRPRVFQDMVCINAWKAISRSDLVAIVDGVRNRLLGLVLELEREAPEAGEVASAQLPIHAEQITHLVQTTIYAGSTTVSDNSIHVQGTAGSIAGGQGNVVRQGDVHITHTTTDLHAPLEVLRAAVERLDGQLPPEQLEAIHGLVEDVDEEAAAAQPATTRISRALKGIAAIATAAGQAGAAVVDAVQACHRALGS